MGKEEFHKKIAPPEDAAAFARYIELQKIEIERQKIKNSSAFLVKYSTFITPITLAFLAPFIAIGGGLLNGQIKQLWFRSEPATVSSVPNSEAVSPTSQSRVENWSQEVNLTKRTVRAASDANFRASQAREACQTRANEVARGLNGAAENINSRIVEFTINRRSGPWYDRWEEQTLNMKVLCEARIRRSS